MARLGDILESGGEEGGYLIAPPPEDSTHFVKTKIYFFDSPLSMEIKISQKNFADQVIKHIMTLYKRTKELSD